MGTNYSITLYSDANSEGVFSESSNILQKVNKEMSTYIEDSLISQINKAELDRWTIVSQDFVTVLDYAINLCKQTKGIYDVSVGKLVKAWGFGPDSVNQQPSEDLLHYLSSQVGCNSIEIDYENLRVKKHKDVELDFSSIAKGFAIDKVYEFLKQQPQIESFFIELGGEIRTTAFKSKNQPWRAGIISPAENSKIIYTFLSSDFDEFALATSGDYRNLKIFNDNEWSHTLNTYTGVPSNFSQSSVSVISNNAMRADALATAINAMTLQEGIDYSNKNNIVALFVVEHEGKPKLLFSEALQQVKM